MQPALLHSSFKLTFAPPPIPSSLCAHHHPCFVSSSCTTGKNRSTAAAESKVYRAREKLQATYQTSSHSSYLQLLSSPAKIKERTDRTPPTTVSKRIPPPQVTLCIEAGHSLSLRHVRQRHKRETQLFEVRPAEKYRCLVSGRGAV